MKNRSIQTFSLILTWILFLTLAGCTGTDAPNPVPAETPSQNIAQEEREPEESGLQFPYTLEEQLVIRSLSTATIPNPDAGGESGEEIAGLEITNNAGQFLVKAELVMTLSDGSTYDFEIHDLPAGGTVLAFDIHNAPYDGKTACKSIEATAYQLADGDQLMSGAVAVEVEETAVTLTNISEEDLGPLKVICLCDFDGIYFGGTSYSYKIDRISAGESVLVDAIDCYLGSAAVVRILADN